MPHVHKPVSIAGNAIAARNPVHETVDGLLASDDGAQFVSRAGALTRRGLYPAATSRLENIVLHGRHVDAPQRLVVSLSECGLSPEFRIFRVCAELGLVSKGASRKPARFGIHDLLRSPHPDAAVAAAVLGFVRSRADDRWINVADCNGQLVGVLPAGRRERAGLALALLIASFTGSCCLGVLRLAVAP